MRGLGSLLAMIMNASTMEKLSRKNIDDVATDVVTANTEFFVVLHSEQGPVEVEVRPGEPILVRLFAWLSVTGVWYPRCYHDSVVSALDLYAKRQLSSFIWGHRCPIWDLRGASSTLMA